MASSGMPSFSYVDEPASKPGPLGTVYFPVTADVKRRGPLPATLISPGPYAGRQPSSDAEIVSAAAHTGRATARRPWSRGSALILEVPKVKFVSAG